ncbi:MAG: JAB domain-containing protein, partial [Candidatus Desantisbacteria bacterium]
VYLDSSNKIIDITDAACGTVNCAMPIVREIIHSALQKFAVSIICAHNHPSGDTKPSKEDRDFTRELCQAGNVMQVKMLDHLIIGDNQYYSFADNGEIVTYK